MKLLMDTQCWLWWFAQPERLSEEAIAHIADEANELYQVRTITYDKGWECKHELCQNGLVSLHI